MPSKEKDFYDPYFYWARPRNRRSYHYQFKNTRIEDLTCEVCGYKPKPSVEFPKQCYRAHMRKQHPREFAIMFKPNFVIHEEPAVFLPV